MYYLGKSFYFLNNNYSIDLSPLHLQKYRFYIYEAQFSIFFFKKAKIII